MMQDGARTEVPLKIGIFCIDYPTLNAAVSLERAFHERGHQCTLVLAQYHEIGDLKARLPSRVASSPFVQTKGALVRLERLRAAAAVPAAAPAAPANAWSYCMKTGQRLFSSFRQRLGQWLPFSKMQERETWKQWLPPLHDAPLSLLFSQVRRHYFARRRELRRARNIIRHHAFDVIIMTHDIEGAITAPFMRAARQLSVPVFLYPYTHSDPDAAFDYFRSDPERQVNGLLKKLVAYLLPKHVYKRKGEKLFYSPFPFVIADTLNRMSLRRPWLPYSSRNSGVFLASENLKQVFLEQGYPKAELRVTGSPDHDVIYFFRKNRGKEIEKIIPKDFIKKEGKNILINIGEDNFSSPSHENSPVFGSWGEFSEFMNEVIRELEKRHNVILSFHPRIPEKDVRKIKGKKAHKTDRYILEVLGCSDMLITYNGSSVISHAIATQIPVIIFDAHGYNYDHYTHAPGVRLFSGRQEFMRFVKALAKTDTPTPPLLPQGPAEECRRYGIIDGRAVLRMEEIMRRHVRRRK